jgi:23S rRNA (cytosine1962-C5)-methyltransferase
VDRYADVMVVHVGARVLLPYLKDVLQHLMAETGHDTVYVMANRDAIQREALPADEVAAHSSTPVQPVEILQDGYRFEADPAGQKTGFFLDQRVNRRRVAAYAKGRSMLSAYCYTGAFEVYAAAAGASSITGIDTSSEALERAKQHLQLNQLATPGDYVRGDVTKVLRGFRDAARSFGLIVLDPPRFVANRGQTKKGLRAYKDANLWALKLLEPGGVLATFSCSGLVSEADFTEAVRWAAADAGRTIRVLEVLTQPPDHPMNPFIPESRYLKGLICWAD